jgi:2-polyprenyl-3-methyl-5-hydroxy-6-metoxy-1,4-benzoquinol methylase
VKQNKYDESEFFAEYSRMPRSIQGLAAGLEWITFRALLPDLREKRVLDLGCGFGWHCRYAQEHGARVVVGIDLSEKMLERARATTYQPEIEYHRCAIEDIDFAANQFDIVISSLALHYVEPFDRVCRKVHHCMTQTARSYFQSNIQSSPRSQPNPGITDRPVNVYIGPWTTTRRKAPGKLSG